MNKRKEPNIFKEFLAPTDDFEEYKRNLEADKARRARRRRSDELNEVGIVPDPSPEALALRARYDGDHKLFLPSDVGIHVPGLSKSKADLYMPEHYVKAHAEIFTSSTGIKPLGPAQIDSTHHSQIIIQKGGRIVKAEPRGFGKTSRSCNEFLLGVLQGYISYGLIICSSLEKAEEIVLSLITEILENEVLAIMYPREVACFLHVETNPRKAESQTYNGEFTYIGFNRGLIRFPQVPGAASSGAILNIRTKKNVRGVYFTDRAGIHAGKRRRPTHLLLDDIQTDEEANNEQVATRLVRLIKKSILRSAGHNKRLAAIMTCTPIAPGDVSHHFLLKEPWQHVIYQMLESRAEREELWLGEYAEQLQAFDKRTPGSQIKAALRALEFYKENREEMDRGAVVNWEWCYEYDDDPQIEISAIQHAYNIIILEGIEVFESECQCNVMAVGASSDITYCSIDTIMSRVNHLPRKVMAVKDRFVVSHIDVGFEYFTYITMSSPAIFTGNIIDYGTFPPYPHRFAKGKMANNLKKMYPHIPIPEDRVTQAVIDLTTILAQRTYTREDGVQLKHNAIMVDHKAFTPYVQKGIRMSPFNNIVHPAEGTGLGARDKGLMEKNYTTGATKYHHTVLLPIPDRTLLKLLVDINYFKSFLHVAFSREVSQTGSMSLFIPEFEQQHIVVAEHCRAEIPTWDIDPRTDKRVVVWIDRDINNEFLDNIVGALGALSMLGVRFDVQDSTQAESYDINEFIRTYS